MRYISTWSMEPFFNSTSTGWVKDEYLLASMLSSLDHVKTIGETPIVYTDKITCEILQDLVDDIVLYDVHTDLFVRDNVPVEFWAYPKMKTYSLQVEPYIHFDLDFMFRQKLPSSALRKDVLCQCWEYPEKLSIDQERPITEEIYNKNFIGDNWQWSEWWTNRDYDTHPALNVGILGMNNMELNEMYCNLTFEWLEMNRDNLFTQKDKLPHSCVFEQQVLAMLIREHGYSINVLQNHSHLAPPFTKLFVHFVGWAYKKGTEWKGVNELRDIFLEPYVTDDVRYYTSKLLEMKKSC